MTPEERERWQGHRREHKLLAAAGAAIVLSHQREHSAHAEAHAREHSLNEIALGKASVANDARFHDLNEFRETLRDQADKLASQESMDAMRVEIDRRFAEATKRTDERFESNRQRIEVLEKGDVKAEGKGLGQSATVAWIVTGLTVLSVVIGIILSLLNALGPTV
jgi:hypothetical protein